MSEHGPANKLAQATRLQRTIPRSDDEVEQIRVTLEDVQGEVAAIARERDLLALKL